jgi:FkbM family methyltransferase
MPKDPRLIFDVGLHKGEDSEFYLKKGFRVVAFEANLELVEYCRRLLRPYVDEGLLTLVAGAIVDPAEIRAGKRKVEFYQNKGSSHWGTIRPNWAERTERDGAAVTTVEVDTVDFIAALSTHGVPHYLKVDIEGCDVVCINALAAFAERPDYVSIEAPWDSFAELRQQIEQLSTLGYQSFKTVEQSEIGGHIARIPALEGRTVFHRFEHGASGMFGAELPGRWLSKRQILRRYRAIHLGYYLLGSKGVLYRAQFRGASQLRRFVRAMLRRINHGAVPGWHDTHARLLPPD